MGYFKVPGGQKVEIFAGNASPYLGDDIDLILDSEVSISFQSNFDSLVSEEVASWAGLITQGINALSGKSGLPKLGVSAKELGFQVWKVTSPAKVSVTVILNNKGNPQKDLVEPAKKLLKISVPFERKGGIGIFAPGPQAIDLIAGALDTTVDAERSDSAFLSVRIGWVSFDWAIITSAEPTWSIDVDDQGYPLWVKITMDIQSVYTPTNVFIDSMLSKNALLGVNQTTVKK